MLLLFRQCLLFRNLFNFLFRGLFYILFRGLFYFLFRGLFYFLFRGLFCFFFRDLFYFLCWLYILLNFLITDLLLCFLNFCCRHERLELFEGSIDVERRNLLLRCCRLERGWEIHWLLQMRLIRVVNIETLVLLELLLIENLLLVWLYIELIVALILRLEILLLVIEDCLRDGDDLRLFHLIFLAIIFVI